ncbi:MAG TPA: hypothetical protein VIH37_06875 [Candidatus Limnocylindrales bacterium]
MSKVPRRLAAGLLAAGLLLVASAPASAATPSGERMHGQSSIEPVYDDMTGAVAYVATPIHVANPVHTNPRAWAPFYLPVYPTGSTVGTLDCMGVPGNCPDHDGLVAGVAMSAVPSVYGGGVIGHDHLMAGPGSGGDFNIAWQPVLVLFTSKAAANEHITTLAQIDAAVARHDAIEIWTGVNGVPDLTFHCQVVPAVVYWNGTPVS